MFASSRIKLRPLSQFCDRIGTALEAGLDLRKILDREATRGAAKYRQSMANVSRAIDRGATLTEALEAEGGYFPEEFTSMVDVGEKTGRLEQILKKMGQHYEYLLQTRWLFLLGIAWPVIQGIAATFVIALLIAINGWVDESFDMLGFGLVGGRDALIFLAGMAGVAMALVFVAKNCMRGGIFAKPIMNSLMRLPKVGGSIRTLNLTRFASSLSLAVEAGLDVKTAARLAIRSTDNEFFQQHIPRVELAIDRGSELHEALATTGAFPQSVLDAVELGEQTGRFAESMDQLSRQLQESSKTAVRTLAIAAGLVVWAGVFGLIIFMIFRLASIYLNSIYSALEGIS
ncbi:MAG: type II secretion system F family protein [Pirellulaceae bacterium]